jgi:hypothetical protein
MLARNLAAAAVLAPATATDGDTIDKIVSRTKDRMAELLLEK